jgi:raffinose/stachyose/melibiose transport system substrate-binding protein
MKRIASLGLLILVMVAVGAVSAAPKTQVKYSTWRIEDKAVWDVLKASFEKENPTIEIVFDFYTDNTVYYNTLTANAVAGTGLDVYDHHPNDQLYIKAASGYMADLSALPFVKNLPEDSKKLVTFDGKIIGYNAGINLICLIYNKEILDQNKIKPPKTFNELVKAIKDLKAKGYGGIGYLGSDVKTDWLSDAMGCSIMGPAVYAKFKEAIDQGQVTDARKYPGVLPVFQSLKAIAQNSLLYDNSVSTSYAASLSLFAQKKTAFVMMGTWTFGTAQNDYPGIKFGIIPFPSTVGSKFYAEPAQITCVFPGSKNLTAAKKWVEFLSRTDNASTYLNAVKWTPALNGVKMNFEGADMLIAAVKEGVAVKMPENTPNVQIWRMGLNQAYSDLLFDNADLDATLNAFNKFLAQVNPQLKK